MSNDSGSLLIPFASLEERTYEANLSATSSLLSWSSVLSNIRAFNASGFLLLDHSDLEYTIDEFSGWFIGIKPLLTRTTALFSFSLKDASLSPHDNSSSLLEITLQNGISLHIQCSTKQSASSTFQQIQKASISSSHNFTSIFFDEKRSVESLGGLSTLLKAIGISSTPRRSIGQKSYTFLWYILVIIPLILSAYVPIQNQKLGIATYAGWPAWVQSTIFMIFDIYLYTFIQSFVGKGTLDTIICTSPISTEDWKLTRRVSKLLAPMCVCISIATAAVVMVSSIQNDPEFDELSGSEVLFVSIVTFLLSCTDSLIFACTTSVFIITAYITSKSLNGHAYLLNVAGISALWPSTLLSRIQAISCSFFLISDHFWLALGACVFVSFLNIISSLATYFLHHEPSSLLSIIFDVVTLVIWMVPCCKLNGQYDHFAAKLNYNLLRAPEQLRRQKQQKQQQRKEQENEDDTAVLARPSDISCVLHALNIGVSAFSVRLTWAVAIRVMYVLTTFGVGLLSAVSAYSKY